jgi:hypothetical protein
LVSPLDIMQRGAVKSECVACKGYICPESGIKFLGLIQDHNESMGVQGLKPFFPHNLCAFYETVAGGLLDALDK